MKNLVYIVDEYSDHEYLFSKLCKNNEKFISNMYFYPVRDPGFFLATDFS